MSGWSSSGRPSSDRADDERLARSLTAGGDTEALIRLLDRYAARLYDYCHALLRDEESAAGALHDAVLAISVHAGRLREQDRFRAWSYALVRNECLRRLRDPDRPTQRHEAPEVEDVFLSAQERAQRLETRRVVHGALTELRGREREALDLLLRHGLAPAEIAGVLGMDVQAATALTDAARRRLDGALAAAVIARTGGQDCPHVAELTAGQAGAGDAVLPEPVARRLIRHIETCATCTERRHRTVSTPAFLQSLPLALLPADLRGHILATASDPACAPDLDRIAYNAEPFDSWGWPLPAGQRDGVAGGEHHDPRSPRLWPAVAAGAAVVLLALGAFIVLPGGEETGAQGPPPMSSAPDVSVSPTDPPDPSRTPTPTPTSTSPTPAHEVTTPTPPPTSKSSTPTPRRNRERPESGRLQVGGCVPSSQGCVINVRAAGGPVTWTATGNNVRLKGSGGQLAGGDTAAVTVLPPEPCERGTSGRGEVTFSPGDRPVTVHWTCSGEDPEGD